MFKRHLFSLSFELALWRPILQHHHPHLNFSNQLKPATREDLIHIVSSAVSSLLEAQDSTRPQSIYQNVPTSFVACAFHFALGPREHQSPQNPRLDRLLEHLRLQSTDMCIIHFLNAFWLHVGSCKDHSTVSLSHE